MWKTLYVSANESVIEKITVLLDNFQIMNRKKRVISDGEGEKYFEVLVPRAELVQAQDILLGADL